MLKKHAVLLSIFISLMMLIIATVIYPGGSVADKTSPGFDWTKNYFSNLFDEKAINGEKNVSRTWADTGMIFLSLGFILFFIRFSRKIPLPGAAKIIKYVGAGGMLFNFLVITPWHDIMVAISGTMFLFSLFYITVFVFRSKLHYLKAFCVICMLLMYYTNYLFGVRDLQLLPIMQKVTFAAVVVLILILEYFTRREHFQQISLHKKLPG